jgi:YggT family protein
MLRGIPYLCQILNLYSLILFAWIILSWIQVPYDHPLGQLRRILSKVIDPIVIPLRRAIPPIRLGAVALDVSVIVIFIAIRILC